MTPRRLIAAVVLPAALLTACAWLPWGPPRPPDDIDLAEGAYAVFYSDSLSREAGVSTVDESGALVTSKRMSAQNLHTRVDSEDAVALIGARAADIVVIGRSGAINVAEIDYPDGTGVTAATWLRDGLLASLINVGNAVDGYQNPLVIHDTKGKVVGSLELRGLLTSVIESDGSLIMAGSNLIPGKDDMGSRVHIVDRSSLTLTKTYDWPNEGGLWSCAQRHEGELLCLETDASGGGPIDDNARRLVSIDLRTGEKVTKTRFDDDGESMIVLDGRVYVATSSGFHLMLDDLSTVEASAKLASTSSQKIERVAPVEGVVDVFVREYTRTEVSGGRAAIGRVVRLDPTSLAITRDLPMWLPDQQLVSVHAIAHEFFAPK